MRDLRECRSGETAYLLAAKCVRQPAAGSFPKRKMCMAARFSPLQEQRDGAECVMSCSVSEPKWDRGYSAFGGLCLRRLFYYIFYERNDNVPFLKQLREDIESVKQRDPAARNALEILLTYSGLHAVFAYRISHALYVKNFKTAARIVSQTARFLTGIEIHPGAKIGKGLFIDHGMGVVIGETAEIGDNCLLYQGVTLGGTGKDKGKRHPTLGNNVMVGSGAKVLGPFKVGDNVKIAANAVVLTEIPPNCTAVGVPARVVRRNGVKPPCEQLDQVHIPDPVSQELCRQLSLIGRLEKRIEKLEKDKIK